jgi:hypothetical protein
MHAHTYTHTLSLSLTHSFTSLLSFSSQELLLPPEPCPQEISRLIDEAGTLHNNGLYDGALEAYLRAQREWDASAGGRWTEEEEDEGQEVRWGREAVCAC